MTWSERLASRIVEREARVGVIGLGYVGRPLAAAVVEAGFDVTGVDVDPVLVERLDERLDADGIGSASKAEPKRWRAVTDFSCVAGLDIVILCVPTPLDEGAPDLSFVKAAVERCSEHLTRGSLVILESTSYPGTTEETVAPLLEQSGLRAGKDFALACSPERIDPGNTEHRITTIPKVVGGLTKSCGDLAESFYRSFVPAVVRVARPREAEMAKLLENTYRQVNIALVNEFAMVAHELDVDIWESIAAASTKPFGFHAFQPGVGTGGHCIAIDPVYLTWRIRELGRAPFRLAELAREVDSSMPTYISKRVLRLLDDASLDRPARVFVLGVTYKPDVDDIRESRALETVELLLTAGVEVGYHDPFHAKVTLDEREVAATNLEVGLEAGDLTLILTHHSSYDWRDVVDRSRRVFDARGVTQEIDDPKITRL